MRTGRPEPDPPTRPRAPDRLRAANAQGREHPGDLPTADGSVQRGVRLNATYQENLRAEAGGFERSRRSEPGGSHLDLHHEASESP